MHSGLDFIWKLGNPSNLNGFRFDSDVMDPKKLVFRPVNTDSNPL